MSVLNPSMFYISKFLSFATQPLAWVAALFAVALLCIPRKRVLGLALGWTSLALLVLLGWRPLPDALLRGLEAQCPPPAWTAVPSAPEWQHYAGIVVLGGALEPAWVRAGNGQVALNDAAERMTASVVLMRQHPQLRLLFTGGEGEFHTTGEPEAVQAREFFENLGVPTQRMQFEAASRTTYENAVLSAVLPDVDKTRPWLLVTSAWHMPRALATFHAAGWNVTPYPVDYRTGTRTPWTEYSMAKSLWRWQLALHEWAGWLAYRAAGHA
ncbi:YdcF family protein [Rhodoferax sediminis]|uniref:YdcF family protein n=1 Tax=Rhodoferax sediminis TaxID=2509614 RepID=A0A515DEE3_9BURK|nr:YdcF family protein [Rhodoferax sediminis]QDL38792.1 YdcF family protein [Rhodoferax sediminis]